MRAPADWRAHMNPTDFERYIDLPLPAQSPLFFPLLMMRAHGCVSTAFDRYFRF